MTSEDQRASALIGNLADESPTFRAGLDTLDFFDSERYTNDQVKNIYPIHFAPQILDVLPALVADENSRFLDDFGKVLRIADLTRNQANRDRFGLNEKTAKDFEDQIKYFVEQIKNPVWLRTFFETHGINDKDHLDLERRELKYEIGKGNFKAPDRRGFTLISDMLTQTVSNLIAVVNAVPEQLEEYERDYGKEAVESIQRDITGRDYLENVLLPDLKRKYLIQLGRGANPLTNSNSSGLDVMESLDSLSYPSTVLAVDLYKRMVNFYTANAKISN